MPAWRGVLFDLDGVLFDTERCYRDAFRATLAQFGLMLDAAAYGALVGVATPARGPMLRAMFGADFPLDAFQAAYRARKMPAAAFAQPKAGAVEAVRDARARGLGVAVATSAGAQSAHALLRRFPEVFDAVVTRDAVAAPKPAPDVFRAAAAAIGCAAHLCVAVEDSGPGILAARAAGCFTAYLPDPAFPAAYVADATLRNLDGLRGIWSATATVELRSAAMADGA